MYLSQDPEVDALTDELARYRSLVVPGAKVVIDYTECIVISADWDGTRLTLITRPVTDAD